MGYKGDTGNSMSDYDEYFESDKVMEIMESVTEYKTGKDFTSLSDVIWSLNI